MKHYGFQKADRQEVLGRNCLKNSVKRPCVDQIINPYGVLCMHANEEIKEESVRFV